MCVPNKKMFRIIDNPVLKQRGHWCSTEITNYSLRGALLLLLHARRRDFIPSAQFHPFGVCQKTKKLIRYSRTSMDAVPPAGIGIDDVELPSLFLELGSKNK
jgi:hypothetical protein